MYSQLSVVGDFPGHDMLLVPIPLVDLLEYAITPAPIYMILLPDAPTERALIELHI
jgi:hypothetical protein